MTNWIWVVVFDLVGLLVVLAVMIAKIGALLRRLEAVEAGHVHGNVNNPARDYTEADLLECESGARTIARSCRCLGILHGARRVVDLSMLPPRDPHFARPVCR